MVYFQIHIYLRDDKNTDFFSFLFDQVNCVVISGMFSCKGDLPAKHTNKDLEKNGLVCYLLQQVVANKTFESLQQFLFIVLALFKQFYYTILVLDSIIGNFRLYNNTVTLNPRKYLFFIIYTDIKMINLYIYLKQQNYSNFYEHLLFCFFCSTAVKVCAFCMKLIWNVQQPWNFQVTPIPSWYKQSKQ